MAHPVSPSQLRQDIYRLIDRVIDTGEPLEIERKGHRLRLIADEPVDRLSRISGNPAAVVGDPDDLISMDWSAEWSADHALDPQ
ncbi:type II toxin-antitoxin system Phd/YefM family antitoxin [Nocardioides albidus]|uniref:Type II toxin-antitoxin system Phd/YefM family antitoxin n=1 Tax=Nocardioides albidus TaxID=1517589 RepID=A0A5C4VSN5_9ACTN|nr:type II toxin-antitoxin system Phd/YefM family antitoxin [Nocardioides albidus]TNM38339.1 type II toxin-antitoxin system Phd/YefM family antitoxin [Nocardioides albidus]